MKRIAIAILLLTIFLYVAENSQLTGFSNFKPSLTVTNDTNEYVLSWSRLPYWAYYEVEVLTNPPENDCQPAPPSQQIVKYRTWSNSFTIDQSFPFRTYWRVSAHGLFRHPLGLFSDCINLAQAMGTASEDFAYIRPRPVARYLAAGFDKPILTWTTVPGAVYYEIEFLSAPPENPNHILPSKFQVFSSREVFTNGYNADLSAYSGSHLYWRVRALDYDGNPLGVFSDAAEISIAHTVQDTLRPVSTTNFNISGTATPLYPVVSWVPIIGAASYEVEILDQSPEIPNNTQPSIHRIMSKEVIGLDYYSEDPFISPGTYYWRVRGLDIAGNAIGTYSDAGQFAVDLTKGSYAATFGDSITHGGGAISYSPSDWEYSFQSYLSFPTVNLGKSGDTSESMVERFERDVLPFHPKFLIILGGTNSLRGGTPAAQVVKDLAAIRDKCLANDIRPIFLTLPPINPAAISRAFNEETVENWRDEFDLVNTFIRQQRYYIDLDPYFSDTNRELPDHYAIDGLHPDMDGKKLMAQIINANWSRVTR